MQHTLVALVENQPGVLQRVANLFSRARLQHREPGRRSYRYAGAVTDDDCGQCRGNSG